MFKEGQGIANKALRYNAERAVSELIRGSMQRIWDQRVIVSVSKAKSLFGNFFKKEKEQNDEARRRAEEAEAAASGEAGVEIFAAAAGAEEDMDDPEDFVMEEAYQDHEMLENMEFEYEEEEENV